MQFEILVEESGEQEMFIPFFLLLPTFILLY
jgi:hypothetical protein